MLFQELSDTSPVSSYYLKALNKGQELTSSKILQILTVFPVKQNKATLLGVF